VAQPPVSSLARAATRKSGHRTGKSGPRFSIRVPLLLASRPLAHAVVSPALGGADKDLDDAAVAHREDDSRVVRVLRRAAHLVGAVHVETLQRLAG